MLRESQPAGNWTRDLLIASPTPYRWAHTWRVCYEYDIPHVWKDGCPVVTFADQMHWFTVAHSRSIIHHSIHAVQHLLHLARRYPVKVLTQQTTQRLDGLLWPWPLTYDLQNVIRSSVRANGYSCVSGCCSSSLERSARGRHLIVITAVFPASTKDSSFSTVVSTPDSLTACLTSLQWSLL